MESRTNWLLIVVFITGLLALAAGIYVFAARAQSQDRLAYAHAEMAELYQVIEEQEQEIEDLQLELDRRR